MTNEPNRRLIVALDVASRQEAAALVGNLGAKVAFYKIGLQLFTIAGPDFVRELVQSGKNVFLDLKLHEIPNSVAGAIRAAADLGVSMITVHASGGTKMLRAATEAAKSYPKLQVLAVTVVTSLTDDDLKETGVAASCAEQVLRLARLAERSGCHGVVCSPQEVAALKSTLSERTAIVTPGVRPISSASQDQTRTATPFESVRAGASFIVVGRPITQAPIPSVIVDSIVDEIATGAAARLQGCD